MYDRVKIPYGKESKLILALFLIFFISLNVVDARVFEEDGKFYVEQELKGKWNLIAGISFSEELHDSSEISLDAIFKSNYYDAENKIDVEIRPNYEGGDIDPLILYSNAFWVFSAKPGKIVYRVSPSFVDKDYLDNYYQLYQGKNLIAINEEMYGKSLDELKGDCEINNAYIWDPSLQNWTQFSVNQDLDFESRDLLTGKGINIIVDDDCKFMEATSVDGGDDGDDGDNETGGDNGGSRNLGRLGRGGLVGNGSDLDQDVGQGSGQGSEDGSGIIFNVDNPSPGSVDITKGGGKVFYYSFIGFLIVLILITIFLILRTRKKKLATKKKSNLNKKAGLNKNLGQKKPRKTL